MTVRLAVALALSLVAATGCEAMDTGASSARKRSPGPGASADDAGEVVAVAKPEQVGGATVPPVVAGPAGEQPAQPGGYKEAIAPLMTACIECHHAGRTIDLSRYPFMAGGKDESADRLVRSLESTMPPSPRPKVDAAVVERVRKWRQEGMKP